MLMTDNRVRRPAQATHSRWVRRRGAHVAKRVRASGPVVPAAGRDCAGRAADRDSAPAGRAAV